jgi:segregation and condensation protein B
MGRPAKAKVTLDTTLTDLPSALRWREWMGRVEAVIFASREPVTRAMLAKVVGADCNLDLIIDDIQAELRGRPYELVAVAGGWQHRTRKQFADAIRTATGAGDPGGGLSESEMQVLLCVGYFQPITRAELGRFFGREISRDVIGHLRSLDLIGSGPRAPQPGAPYTYVTTKAFLAQFGFDTLRDLPDIEALEDAGLLRKDKLFAGDKLPADAIDGEDPDHP